MRFTMRLAIAVAVLGNQPAYGQDTPPIVRTSTPAAVNPACSASYDCDIGFVCREGRCIDGRGAACKGTEECAGGDACVLGICAVPAPKTAPSEAAPSSCRVDRDCPGDLVCEANVCVAPGSTCKNDRDCPGDQLCDGGACIAPPAQCQMDRDCEGALICEGGRCLEPKRPSTPAATVTTSAEGPACKGLGGSECPRGMVCRYFRCQEPPPETITYEPFRIGLFSLFSFSRGGSLDNAGTASELGADLTVSVSKVFRFHFQLGWERLNGFNGLRAAPLVLGFGIPIVSGRVRVEIELIAALVQSEILFGDGISVGLSSGFRLQGVVGWGPLFVAIVPAGLEVRYLAIHEDAADPGVGLGQSLMFTFGYER